VTYYVRAPFVLMPEGAARIFATVDGTLTTSLKAGERVASGAVVAQLGNADIQLDLTRLEGEHRLQQLRVEHLERLRGVDTESSDGLPTARAALAATERRLADARREAQRLSLVAPHDGVLMPAPNIDAELAESGRLPSWSGSVLDIPNRGAWVKAGTLVCLVGDPGRLSAVLLVDDTDVKRVRAGQTVRLRIDEIPGQVIEGQVVDVARHQASNTDSAAAGQADLGQLWNGVVSPGEEDNALYQVRVEFERPAYALLVGGRGTGKIAAERITLARRVLRYLAHTFRLPM
jgi:putative peptide zinc metalloprotease protein